MLINANSVPNVRLQAGLPLYVCQMLSAALQRPLGLVAAGRPGFQLGPCMGASPEGLGSWSLGPLGLAPWSLDPCCLGPWGLGIGHGPRAQAHGTWASGMGLGPRHIPREQSPGPIARVAPPRARLTPQAAVELEAAFEAALPAPAAHG